MIRFLGRSDWVIAVVIAAVVSVPDGARAQYPLQMPVPTIASEPTIDELFRQGNAAQTAGRFAEAEQFFRAVLRRDPRNAFAYNNLGNALGQQGKLDEAIAQLRQAIVLDPKFAFAYNNLGNALSGQGQLEEAITQYRQALDLPDQPGTPASAHTLAHNGLGIVLSQQGKLDEAINQFHQAITLDPKFPTAYNGLGIVLSQQGKLDEAIAQYRQAISLDPKFAAAYNGLGIALGQQGKLDEAIVQFRQVIVLDPKSTLAYNNLGIVLSDQGKLEEAITQYRQALDLPDQPGTPASAHTLAHNGLGNALNQQGKLDEAIEQFHQAIALDPKFPTAYNGLGIVLSQQGKLDEAIAQFRLGLALFSQRESTGIQTHTYLHNSLGYALELQDNLEAAIVEYEQAVALDPKYAAAQNNLRVAREKLAARRSPPVLDDLAFVPPPERNPKVALFRATVIVEARFGATGQDAGGLNRGAGWVVKREGDTLWIVTCRHNVIDRLDRPGTEPTVQFYSLLPTGQTRRKLTTVELVQQDKSLDIAVLKVTGAPSDIKPLVMAEESQVQFTGRVMAIGHPYNQDDSWVAPSGDRASYNPQRTKFSFSAPIATGHSGGPVFDESDRLIGMVAEISDETSGTPDPNSETPNLRNFVSTGELPKAIRIQPIREKLQTWGILP